MPQFYIRAYLPTDRNQTGVISLFRDRSHVGAWFCRGKADNARAAKAANPDRDPTRPYGDTPSGTYAPTPVVHLSPPHATVGRAWIPLVGIDGQALDAVHGGRTGLGIHANRGEDLAATYGCLRMRQSAFDQLIAIIGRETVGITFHEVSK